MGYSKDIEAKRIAIQAKIDDSKSQAERNRLGQFATPAKLALDILQYAKELTGDQSEIRFLDPAFGTGSFYSALIQTFPSEIIAKASGFEIDPLYGEPASYLWGSAPLDLRIEDFTQAELPTNEESRFNLIICNPPYVRHHHIANGEKNRLQSKTDHVFGGRVSGLAGLYCYFIGLSHYWMSYGGIAGWLIPSEFMDVNYGRLIKRYLLNEVTLLRVHRFDPNDIQFDDALVSSAVVWFRNVKKSEGNDIVFTYGGTLNEPSIAKILPREVLTSESKWTRFPTSGIRRSHSGSTLGDYFTIKRGLATGNNKFFILHKDEIVERNLPLQFFRPILPSPRYLPQLEVRADDKGLPLIERRLFLLDCPLPENEIQLKYPHLWKYLREGIEKGVNERYLSRHRSPWYSQEKRPPSRFICTYIGRTDTRNKRPFRFILNNSRATVSNSYLIMYPKPELAHLLENDPGLVRQVWEALNRIAPKSMIDEGRVYGGGLYKLEPKELSRVPALELRAFDSKIDSVYQQRILFEDDQQACNIATS